MTQHRFLRVAGCAALACMVLAPTRQALEATSSRVVAVAKPMVFQAAGPNAAAIQSTVDQLRAALGGVNNGNAVGPIATGRREINWDGGGSSATSVVPNVFDGFLINRGARFATPGTAFVQAPPQGLADTFGRQVLATSFQPFSPLRLFAPIGSNRTDAVFFVPGGANIRALTSGFGVVFSDVDRPDGTQPGVTVDGRLASTRIRYFGAAGTLIYSTDVPASTGNATFSFFGIVFPTPEISSVRIFTGDAALDVARGDAVAMDDFIYGEPQPRP